MKTLRIARFSSGLLRSCLLSFLLVSTAEATPVLTYDNRTITISGFGQVEGYYGSWDHSATPIDSYAAFNSSLLSGVNFPPATPDRDNFTLDTYAQQESSVTSTHFMASGEAWMATGNNNEVLNAAGEMHVKSIFDIGFDIFEQTKADLTANLALSSIGPNFSNGSADGQVNISLIDTDTMSSIFSYSYDYLDREYSFTNVGISDFAFLSPGSYKLLVSTINEISYTDYADFEAPDHGWGAYDFDMKLTPVPEPSCLGLVGIGLVALALRKRKNNISKTGEQEKKYLDKLA